MTEEEDHWSIAGINWYQEGKNVIVERNSGWVTLEPLPWTDKPEHLIAQRRNEEGSSHAVGAFIKLCGLMGMYEDCGDVKCRRSKACRGTERYRDGPKKGLYISYPPCFTQNREAVAETLREVGLAPEPLNPAK